MGQSNGGKVGRGYGAKDIVWRFGMEVLIEAVASVNYPGLQIPRFFQMLEKPERSPWVYFAREGYSGASGCSKRTNGVRCAAVRLSALVARTMAATRESVPAGGRTSADAGIDWLKLTAG